MDGGPSLCIQEMQASVCVGRATGTFEADSSASPMAEAVAHAERALREAERQRLSSASRRLPAGRAPAGATAPHGGIPAVGLHGDGRACVAPTMQSTLPEHEVAGSMDVEMLDESPTKEKAVVDMQLTALSSGDATTGKPSAAPGPAPTGDSQQAALEAVTRLSQEEALADDDSAEVNL